MSWILNINDLVDVVASSNICSDIEVAFSDLDAIFECFLWKSVSNEAKYRFYIRTGAFEGEGVKDMKSILKSEVLPKWAIWAKSLEGEPLNSTKLNEEQRFCASYYGKKDVYISST